MSEVIVRDSIEGINPREQKVEKASFSLVERRARCVRIFAKSPSVPGSGRASLRPATTLRSPCLSARGFPATIPL